MIEQEELMKSKKSLLKKYEIPIDHISFEYVEKCNDRKELEKIVKILRSGEEGHFPLLTQCAETRLRQVAPESHVLRTEEPTLTKSTLEPDHWDRVSNEIEEWTGEMRTREEELKKSSSIYKSSDDLPAVRNVKMSKMLGSHNDKQEAGPSRMKSAVPRNYADWDKFDVDKELLKMELEDERRKEQAMKKKRQQEKEKKKNKRDEDDTFSNIADNLSATEKEFMAAQEKDRGNEYYRSGDYDLAVKHYTCSILLCPTPAAYNNRAIAYLKLHKFGAALTDCNQVLEADPLNVKALLRRGTAHQNSNNYEQAFEDFCKVVGLEPDNKLAKSLSEQMKKKCGSNLKSVRMTIEDEPTGFVFPAPRHNVAVNEWGLAKTMCRCNGIPAWSCRTAPKCRICKRKRADRRTEKEEERQKIKQATEDTSEMGEERGSIVVKVTPAADDGRDEQSNENISSDQMQIDEKGSGDILATEKSMENVVQENSELPLHKDLISSELDSRKGSRELREQRVELENMLEIKKLKDAEGKAFMSRDNNVAMEKREGGNFESDKKEVKQTTSEVKLKLPLSSDISTAMETDKRGDTRVNKKNIGNASLEANKLKNEKLSVGNSNSSNETVQTEGNEEKNTPSEASGLKDTKQKISPGIGNTEPQQTKVKCSTKQSAHEEGQSVNIITSPYEFMKVWQALKGSTDVSGHAQVMRAVQPVDLQTVVGNKLDGPMLSTILHCLEKHFAPELALEYLEKLVLLPRFNIAGSFLESSEKQAVHLLLKELQ
ncbi:hypothetical protein B7P43_G06822, partial [Cryptotermes secundus]